MKTLLTIAILLGLSFMIGQWVSYIGLPEYRRKKLNEAALKFYKDKNYIPENIRSFAKKPYYDGEIPPNPPNASYYVDSKNLENPVKIYEWQYYICPEHGEKLIVKKKPPKYGFTEVKCEQAEKIYRIKKEDLQNFELPTWMKLFNIRRKK